MMWSCEVYIYTQVQDGRMQDGRMQDGRMQDGRMQDEGCRMKDAGCVYICQDTQITVTQKKIIPTEK